MRIADHGVDDATAPDQSSGYVTGLGDLTLMDIFILPKQGDTTVSIGVVLPTATGHSLGSGQWQAGAAGVVVAPQNWSLVGGLVTYQTSFAGQSERPDVNLLTFQPIVNYNLSDGWDLRSSAIWNFNMEHGKSYIPVGFGAGEVIPLERASQ
jgi:hypothetical protein